MLQTCLQYMEKKNDFLLLVWVGFFCFFLGGGMDRCVFWLRHFALGS